MNESSKCVHLQRFIVVTRYESKAVGSAIQIEDPATQRALLHAIDRHDMAFNANNKHGKEERYYDLPESLKENPAIRPLLQSQCDTDEWYVVITCT